jgi:hypothetical protein
MLSLLVDVGENVQRMRMHFRKWRMKRFGQIAISGRFVNDQSKQSIN